MIKELIYFLIILSGIPVGFFLSKICNEEIKNWKKRFKLIIIACFVIIIALIFLEFKYKVSVIVTLFWIIVTFGTILLKR